jgi:hypothetical protein
MLAPPSSLDAIQARTRDIYAAGWRAPVPPGPTRNELATLVTAAASSQSYPAADSPERSLIRSDGSSQTVTGRQRTEQGSRSHRNQD